MPRYRFKFVFRSTYEMDVFTEETPENFEKRWDDYWSNDPEDMGWAKTPYFLRLTCVSSDGQPIVVRINPADVDSFILFSSTMT